MNRILDLATTFQQASKKELETTNEIVKNAIKQHEKNLIEQLEHANRNLVESIQIEQKKLIKNTVNMYKIPTLIGVAILIILAIVISILTMKAQKAYQEMITWKNSAQIAQKLSGDMRFFNCQTDNGKKPCIEIDKHYLDQYWGNNGTLVIPKIYNKEEK